MPVFNILGRVRKSWFYHMGGQTASSASSFTPGKLFFSGVWSIDSLWGFYRRLQRTTNSSKSDWVDMFGWGKVSVWLEHIKKYGLLKMLKETEKTWGNHFNHTNYLEITLHPKGTLEMCKNRLHQTMLQFWSSLSSTLCKVCSKKALSWFYA
jgi:hypothetical protein